GEELALALALLAGAHLDDFLGGHQHFTEFLVEAKELDALLQAARDLVLEIRVGVHDVPVQRHEISPLVRSRDARPRRGPCRRARKTRRAPVRIRRRRAWCARFPAASATPSCEARRARTGCKTRDRGPEPTNRAARGRRSARPAPSARAGPAARP